MITVENVTKRFEKVTALDNVSLEIDNGNVYGLVGSNGSGKSTLLRLVSGVYSPDKGVVGIDRIASFNNPAVKSQIAFLADSPFFFAQSDINEMASFYNSMYPAFDYDLMKKLLTVFPLDSKGRLSSFSKGMQRQAALVLALSSRPKYILLDEAFDGLDVIMRRVLANLLLEGTESSGSTVVIASHNLRELEEVCDHVGVIHKGKLLQHGSVDSLQGSVHKVQAAFSLVPQTQAFDRLDILKIERSGSLLQMIVRGEKDEIMNRINGMCPLFAECIEPTLEEIFVYELEAIGYDVKNILS